MSDDGLLKSAILLTVLGEDEAAEVLKLMGPREVQKLGKAMAEMETVDREKLAQILEDFNGEAEAKSGGVTASKDYIRATLTKALGDDRAAQIIDRIMQGGDTNGFDGLKWLDAAAIAELVRNEHPQIIATILVHLDADQASEVLSNFVERLRNDVVLRIATLDGVQPGALRELNDTLVRLLSGANEAKKSQLGGVRAAAEVLNFVPSTLESSIIESIKGYDEDLAQKIMDEMFVFEDLLELDDRAIQLILREVQSDSLIVALKGASEELRNKMFKNMSQRAAEQMKEDLESKGPVKVSDVEAEQRELLKVVRRLGDEGQIALGGKGEDSFV
jgi:flagellar motor switch protein FliG